MVVIVANLRFFTGDKVKNIEFASRETTYRRHVNFVATEEVVQNFAIWMCQFLHTVIAEWTEVEFGTAAARTDIDDTVWRCQDLV